MAALDAMVAATSLGAIRADFANSIEVLQWTLNAYNLSFAVLLLTGAAVGDRFGRRRIFLTGTGLFVLASIACAVAPNAEILIAGRALQGVGAALLMPLARLPLPRRSRLVLAALSLDPRALPSSEVALLRSGIGHSSDE